MKKYSIITIVFISQLILMSCEKKTSQALVSQSPDQKLEISIQAERYTSLDPWMVSITLNQINPKERIATVSQEIMASKIDTENVSFNWVDNSSCQLTFTQTDGSVVNVPVRIEYNSK